MDDLYSSQVLSPPPLITPPGETSPAIISTAQTVLRAQAQALTYLSDLYDSDPTVQSQFFLALQYMHNAILSNGKIVVTGMGKSYKIADKLVATMNSLGIHSVSLHPSDALHGDLGIIKPADVVMMITASGNTPELINLLAHVCKRQTLLCLTCDSESPLAKMSSAVLSAKLPTRLTEKEIYGLAAPTTSTTACLVVGDAICITLAEMLISDQKQRQKNFGKCHPGGAIGLDYAAASANNKQSDSPLKFEDWNNIGVLSTSLAGCDEISLLRVSAGKNWLLINSRYLISTKDVSKVLTNDWSETLKNLERIITYDILEIQRRLKSELSLDDMGNQLCIVVDDLGDFIGLYDGTKPADPI